MLTIAVLSGMAAKPEAVQEGSVCTPSGCRSKHPYPVSRQARPFPEEVR
jgi:hypothetical protein